MESLGLSDFGLIVGTAIAGAAFISLLGRVINGRLAPQRGTLTQDNAPVFLLDGDTLADATVAAQKLIKHAPPNQTDRQAVLTVFQDRFPTLDYIMSQVGPGASETLSAADGSAQRLKVEDIDGNLRLTLEGASIEDHENLTADAVQEGVARELSFLRDLTDQTPQLIWTQDFSGKLTWANAAYLTLSDQCLGHREDDLQVWPETPIFEDAHLEIGTERRIELTLATTRERRWFNVVSRRTSSGSLHFATPADEAVKAEQSKAKAMQTSARLFANLATGLAIFDQKRRLAIFNPRLTDLTRLEPQFLTTRPTIDMFLDALRESRVLPEPKSYATWREQFSALEDAARAGTYCENWDLNDGQTFRVTGKPYEDNSFVFMFDDITAEINLTRRFKTDIETGQGVMDAQDHAIAVFSANGTLVQSNKAYQELWGDSQTNSMTVQVLRNEIASWQSRCAAGPDWGKLREYIGERTRAKTWTDHLILDDGRDILCEAKALNANMTLISFKTTSDQKLSPVIHKLTLQDPSLHSAKR